MHYIRDGLTFKGALTFEILWQALHEKGAQCRGALTFENLGCLHLSCGGRRRYSEKKSTPDDLPFTHISETLRF